MNSKPKLLLIAGYFPPVRVSTGSIRPWNLARCLISLGWDVTVVTPKISLWRPEKLDNVEHVMDQIELLGIKMIYSEHQLKCLAPWRYNLPKGITVWFFGGVLRILARFFGIQNWVGWVPSALNACKKLDPNNFDVILATGAPFWGFEIAYRLSKKLNKPYVIDYRDLWTNNPWHPVNQKWVQRQEKKLINNSSAVTIVSPISGEVLSAKYHVGDKVHTITNGFDRNDVQGIYAKKFDHFAIIFAGLLIPPKLTLFPLLKALHLIKHKETKNWIFHYFGPSVEEATKEVTNCDLLQESIIHGSIPRREVIPYLKGATLNVVISSNADAPKMEDKGVIPGKVFELIGLEAPILSIVPKGSAVEGVLRDVGVESFSHEDIDGIVSYIVDSINGFKAKIINKEKYSWEELSNKFDLLLKDIAQYDKQNN